jgi:hypothetical protein
LFESGTFVTLGLVVALRAFRRCCGLNIQTVLRFTAGLSAVVGGVVLAHFALSSGQAPDFEIWVGIIALNAFMILTIFSSILWLATNIAERRRILRSRHDNQG